MRREISGIGYTSSKESIRDTGTWRMHVQLEVYLEFVAVLVLLTEKYHLNV